MPNIEGYKLTNKGNALQIKVEAGKCKLNITKLKLGSGTASGDIVNLTDLVQAEQTVLISKIEVVDDYTCRITGLVTNQGLNKTYYIREIGLYAQDPDDGEILYLVAVDKNPDVMPADNYQMIISQEFNIDVVVSNVDSVNVTSQPVHLITDDELNKKIEEHNTSANPHENIFKRVLITEAKTAANTADWNTLTESRTYKISGATFAADKHQPVGAVGTGELVVLKNGDDTIAQVYYANSAAYDKAGAYHRMCISGTWTDWVYNITNKGGNVTGDFDINGKLTVDSIEVSNQLTIGGAPPLGQDAIDKLQAQIIAPTQTIYVSNHGNDETGTGSSNNPIKTLDKAQELIKTNVSNITIYLDNTDDDIEYTFTIQPFDSKSNTNITIRAKDYWSAAGNNAKKPILKPIFYKEPTTANNQFRMGWYLCLNFTSVRLENLRIKYPNEANINTTYYNTYLIRRSSSLIISRCIIDLIQNSTIMNAISSDTNVFKIDYSTITGNEDNSNYLAGAGSINVTVDLADPDNMEKWTTWGSTEIGVFSFLTQVGSTISNVNKLPSNCVSLYSNIT